MPDALDDYLHKKYNKFIVQNITPDRKKTIHLFGFPIPYLQKRDLLSIHSVDASVIKDSLLRGVLKNRILARDILVLQSDIDLQEFNLDQKDFLKSAGIVIGLNSPNAYVNKSSIKLTGEYNGSSRTYYFPEKVNLNLNDVTEFAPTVYHNGRLLIPNEDYILIESQGSGAGYDAIKLIAFAPNQSSNLIADYYVKL